MWSTVHCGLQQYMDSSVVPNALWVTEVCDLRLITNHKIVWCTVHYGYLILIPGPKSAKVLPEGCHLMQ